MQNNDNKNIEKYCLDYQEVNLQTWILTRKLQCTRLILRTVFFGACPAKCLEMFERVAPSWERLVTLELHEPQNL